MRHLPAMTAALALLCTPLAHAEEAGLRDVLSCRQITGPEERLACYDAATLRLEEADRAGEVRVITRAEVEKVRRESFGFRIPSLPSFAGNGSAPDEDVERITEPVRSVSVSAGRLQVTLEDGSVWTQIDDKPIRARRPASAEIFQAALGSYKMKLDGGLAFRVRRER